MHKMYMSGRPHWLLDSWLQHSSNVSRDPSCLNEDNNLRNPA